MLRLFVPFAVAVAACVSVGAAAAQSSYEAAGRLIAQRNCGGCHAITEGDSPLADAPPFRLLYKRYPVGGLGWLLSEGMIAPPRPWEEAQPPRHSRMPMAELDVDEVASLVAYLKSLDPRESSQGR